jgi:hypothetical protein
MRAMFKSYWVRKLIGKLGVPYNRRLRVRSSPHPLNYDADLSLAAAESNAFRIHSDLLFGAVLIAGCIRRLQIQTYAVFSEFISLMNCRGMA